MVFGMDSKRRQRFGVGKHARLGGGPFDTLAFSGCLIFVFHLRGHGVTGMA